MKHHCNKIDYRTKKEAIKNMRKINATNPGYHLRHAYHCQDCRNWHLSSIPHIECVKVEKRIKHQKRNPVKVKEINIDNYIAKRMDYLKTKNHIK